MNSSLGLYRSAGYGLLLLTLISFSGAFLPPELSNYVWVFQTAGGLVDRSMTLLVGFIFIFYDGQEARGEKEMFLLRILSWLTLLLAGCYLALLAIIFTVSPVLDEQYNSAVNEQFDPSILKLRVLELKVEKASTTELINLMKQEKTIATTDPQVFKSKTLKDLAAAEQSLKDRAAQARNTQTLSLLKTAFKWGLGALVVAVLFFWIWSVTDWARDY